MRFPDEDDYRYAGGLKRLWYKIICPFTFGARLWIVTTSILCALAVIQSANGSWGYHGRAQDTGFLSGDFVNGVRLAWQIDAADAGLDRIDNFRVGDEYIYLVGYKGAQRSVVAYDASYSTPRELWRTDINDDEEGMSWWGDDLLVGNTLVSTADGSTRSDWPTPGVRLVGSPYQHPSGEGPSTGPIGPVRLYSPHPLVRSLPSLGQDRDPRVGLRCLHRLLPRLHHPAGGLGAPTRVGAIVGRPGHGIYARRAYGLPQPGNRRACRPGGHRGGVRARHAERFVRRALLPRHREI